MDRNLLTALLLSALVIFGYYALFPPAEEALVKEKVEASADSAQPEPSQTTASLEAPTAAASPMVLPAGRPETKEILVDTPLYKAVLSTDGGQLKSLQLKKYRYAGPDQKSHHNWIYALFSDSPEVHYDPDRLVEMVGHPTITNRVWEMRPFLADKPDNQQQFFQASRDNLELITEPETLTLTAVLPSGMVLEKRITFRPNSYLIDVEYRLDNPTGAVQSVKPIFNFGAGAEPVEFDKMSHPPRAGYYLEGSFLNLEDDDFEKVQVVEKLSWASVTDTYFVSAMRPKEEKNFSLAYYGISAKVQGNDLLVPRMEYQEASFELEPGQRYKKAFTLYMGPKVQEEMEHFDMSLPATLDLGWFDFIAYPMLALLRMLYPLAHNWGVAIILLTFIVRILLFPLAYKGMRSMRRMGQLNPRMKVLREKYKNDKEKMNQEIMELYKKNKINPLGGCLPLLLQVPVFIALYSALMPAIELRHQAFAFWMGNLSASDYTLILPVLMGISMFIQQHLTPQPAMDPTQAKVMKFMPLMLVFFFLDMPSGLVLYWVVSNILTLFQQMIFNRVKEAEIQH